jgi:hypothetical protein
MERAERVQRLSSAVTALTRAVLESAAATSGEVRRGAFDGSVRDVRIAGYVALVERDARLVTDSQLTQLRDEGLSEDGIFELTVAAALGAAQRRLDAVWRCCTGEGGAMMRLPEYSAGRSRRQRVVLWGARRAGVDFDDVVRVCLRRPAFFGARFLALAQEVLRGVRCTTCAAGCWNAASMYASCAGQACTCLLPTFRFNDG